MARRLLAILVAALMIAGCFAVTASASAAQDKVTLKVYIPGDRPPNMDAVLAEAESRMADTVNAKINLTFIPWSDLGSKTQVMLAAGEVIDLIFDAPWLHMNEMIAAGYYRSLDDLVAEYGPNIISTRSELMLNSNKVNGQLYGIPLGSTHENTRQYTIRKDLREKLGFEPITSFDELSAFLYAVKENEPSIIPFSTSPSALDMSVANMRVETNYDLQMRVTQALGQSMALNYQGNDGVVHNLLDDMPEVFWGYITDARQWYLDKIVYQDILAGQQQGDLLNAGQLAVGVDNSPNLNYTSLDTLRMTQPDGDLETFVPYKFEAGKNISSFQQGNFQFVPMSSKNPERAIQFLNWANSSQANYDLLAYGLEGTDWIAVGDNQYEAIGTGYNYFPFAWIWNPQQERLNARWTEEEVGNTKFFSEASNFVPSILIGFTFDATPVTNEITVYSTLESKYLLPLFNGVVDPDTTWAAFKAEAYDTVKVIQVELQGQVDAFLNK
ncbi:ABC transporter substrate-binding protein [Clostridia bacterium]|nr:ABC transporter substrate-binding protein [Clostridia bacterium]